MKKCYRALLLLSACLALTSVQAQLPVTVTLQEEVSREVLAAEYVGIPVGYGIRVYKMTYTTLDVFGRPDTASGLLAVPFADGSALAFPVAVYQHGTSDSRFAVPSNPEVGERQLVYALSGQGYITLAPDYLGLGDSRGFHPYVHAESEASAALDMLRALRAYAAEANIYWNEQLFLTGYSQGGHASMALHRAIELEHAGEFTVTAAAHMSGPYSISGVMRELILSDMPYYYPAYLINTYLSYNYVYGIYEDESAIFRESYLPTVEAYAGGEISLSEANSQLIAGLTAEAGAPITRLLLQDSIVDILQNRPEHPLNQVLRANDVYDWTPRAPTRLVYCRADDQVSYRNSIVADSVMRANGAANVAAVDVNPLANHNECVRPAAVLTSFFFAQYRDIVSNAPEAEAMPRYELYPNPTGNALFLRGLTTPALAELFDLQGRRRLSRRIDGDGQGLDVAQLPGGLYFLRVTQGNQVRTDRVVVQH